MRYIFAIYLLIIGAACGEIPTIKADDAQVKKLQRIDYNSIFGNMAAISAGKRDAPRIIFIHGTPGERNGFADFLLNVPRGINYISIDRPGFGQSDPKSGLMSLKDQAKAIEPLLITQNSKKPILVGHSLGGPLAIRIASDYPDKVGAVISLAGSFDPDLENPHWAQYIGNTWLGNAILPHSLEIANKELLAHERELRILAPLIKTISQPVLIVQGKIDDLVPEANADFLADNLSEGVLIYDDRIPQQNHFLPWNNMHSINKAIMFAIKAVW